jgi:hypothetical protein
MNQVDEAALDRMGRLNNAVVDLIGGSDCSPVEAINVLRVITARLDESFELSVMGNPVARMAKKLREKEKLDGSNVEEDSVS